MDYKEQQKQLKAAWKKSRAGTPPKYVEKDGQLIAVFSDRSYVVPTHQAQRYSKKEEKNVTVNVTSGFRRKLLK